MSRKAVEFSMIRWETIRFAIFRILTAAFLLADGQRANASPSAVVVQAQVDVNGDGQFDELRMDENGTVQAFVTGDPPATARSSSTNHSKITSGSFQLNRQLNPSGDPIIVATTKRLGPGPHIYIEASVLSYSTGELTTLWQGPLRGTTQHNKLRMFIEAGEFGLIQYNSREDVFRCDGKTAYLDALRFDFKTQTFRPATQAVRVDNDALLLTAAPRPRAKATPVAPSVWFHPRGASSSEDAATSQELVAPVAVADQQHSTAWIENKNGFGRGEFVSFTASLGTAHVRALRLFLGHGGSQNHFNRPKRLALLLGKTHQYWIDIPKHRLEHLWVTLPRPVATNCVTLIIDDVWPTKSSQQNSGRTAISEISVLTTEEHQPKATAERLIQQIIAGKRKADTRRLLKLLGPSVSESLQAALARPLNSHAQYRLRIALAMIPSAPEEIVNGLLSPNRHSDDYRAFILGLRKLGAASLPALIAALERPLDKNAYRRVTLALQTATDEKSQDALLASVGLGSYRQRNAIISVLGAQPKSWSAVRDAIKTSTQVSRVVDLHRTLTHFCQSSSDNSSEYTGIAALIATFLTEAALPYKPRYLLLQSAGNCNSPLVLSALNADFDRLRKTMNNDATSTALAEVAIASIAKISRNTNALSVRIRDPAPSIRLAILDNLPDDTPMTNSIANLVRNDRWPEVRRHAVNVLAAQCQEKKSLDTLIHAVRFDSDGQVANTSLAAVLSCLNNPSNILANKIFSLLLSLLNDTTRPLDLRLTAARNLARLPVDDAEQRILGHFRDIRRASLTDHKNAFIASAMTTALAELETPDAISLLETSASDLAFPQLQTAAVTALSAICPTSSAALFQALTKSKEYSVSRAATIAVARCR